MGIVVRITDTVTAGDVLTNTVEAYGDSSTDVDPYADNNVWRAAVTVSGRKVYLPVVFKSHSQHASQRRMTAGLAQE